jgi:hypothetical protein
LHDFSVYKCRILFFQIRSGNNNISTNNISTASTDPSCRVETDNNVEVCGEALAETVQENSICNTGTAGSLITRSDAGGGTTSHKRGRNSHTTSIASTGHGCHRSTHEPTPSPTRKRNLLGSTVRSFFQSRNKDRLEHFFHFCHVVANKYSVTFLFMSKLHF